MSFWVIGIVEAAPDQALDGEEGVFGIGDALALGGLADQALAIGGKGDDGRGGAGAFRILDDLGGRALHDRHAGIGGAQVDADYFSHCFSPSSGGRAERPLPVQAAFGSSPGQTNEPVEGVYR